MIETKFYQMSGAMVLTDKDFRALNNTDNVNKDSFGVFD